MHIKVLFLWHKWEQSGHNIGQNRAKFVAMPKGKIGKFLAGCGQAHLKSITHD